jgi:hypothetical protein
MLELDTGGMGRGWFSVSKFGSGWETDEADGLSVGSKNLATDKLSVGGRTFIQPNAIADRPSASSVSHPLPNLDTLTILYPSRPCPTPIFLTKTSREALQKLGGSGAIAATS